MTIAVPPKAEKSPWDALMFAMNASPRSGSPQFRKYMQQLAMRLPATATHFWHRPGDGMDCDPQEFMQQHPKTSFVRIPFGDDEPVLWLLHRPEDRASFFSHFGKMEEPADAEHG